MAINAETQLHMAEVALSPRCARELALWAYETRQTPYFHDGKSLMIANQYKARKLMWC